ncbi:hypothetical protein G6F21_014465 [Rhizopus arrhizus]|nr:hypothetical protein G6F21_014465 [Rhizopus arrhizus]KAG0865246.1 hypothetical protein G6F34_014285 [Rhizopus arrhizus]KAG1065630.1 hypothetical protein G6F40_017807 [Rhizopus arrhizus]
MSRRERPNCRPRAYLQFTGNSTTGSGHRGETKAETPIEPRYWPATGEPYRWNCCHEVGRRAGGSNQVSVIKTNENDWQ